MAGWAGQGWSLSTPMTGTPAAPALAVRILLKSYNSLPRLYAIFTTKIILKEIKQCFSAGKYKSVIRKDGGRMRHASPPPLSTPPPSCFPLPPVNRFFEFPADGKALIDDKSRRIRIHYGRQYDVVLLTLNRFLVAPPRTSRLPGSLPRLTRHLSALRRSTWPLPSSPHLCVATA